MDKREKMNENEKKLRKQELKNQKTQRTWKNKQFQFSLVGNAPASIPSPVPKPRLTGGQPNNVEKRRKIVTSTPRSSDIVPKKEPDVSSIDHTYSVKTASARTTAYKLNSGKIAKRRQTMLMWTDTEQCSPNASYWNPFFEETTLNILFLWQ